MSISVNQSSGNTISVSVSDGTSTTFSTSSSEVSITRPSENNIEVKAQGPKGDTGATGPAGPQGPAGVDGAGGLVDVVDDTTPQLGGDLDVFDGTTAFKLTTTETNGDIQFTPNGTGKINLDGTVQFKRFSAGSPPTAFEGGMYADDNDNLYFGVSDS